MSTIHKFILWLLLSTVNVGEANKDVKQQQRGTRATSKTSTDVVSLDFCSLNLPADDKEGKNTLGEVHTYAELKQDPRASLPDSFTVCSTIMTAVCPTLKASGWATFLNILNNNRGQFLEPLLIQGTIKTTFAIELHESSKYLIGKTPPLFPNQWTRSCMAVNTTSGLIQWVVDGILVLDREFVEVKNPKSRPRDLSRNVILGAVGSNWYALSQKVTNLDIFSSTLTTDKMKSMTGKKSCVEEGDYLAWGDMEWILHGQARMETRGVRYIITFEKY